VRAIVLNSFSGPDGLELSEVAEPSPGDGEELVNIRAASLGPWDLSTTHGGFAGSGGSSDFPQVQGWDFAGETLDGHRVLGFVPQPWMGVGSFAERIVVPSAILSPLPEGLGFEDASMIPVCGITARLLLDAAGVGDADVLLVTGAAGMVGGFAMELASKRGARVVAAVRAPDAAEARRLGAETTFDAAEDLEVALRREFPEGVDACVDTVGLASSALACVRDAGAFVTSVPAAVPEPARRISPSTVQVQPDADAAAALADQAAQGELTVRLAMTLPLESFRDAYSRLESGGLRGKIAFVL
jgi:NADPH:quinone reductase-like Zn-dependent oxidoreductase